ncbi:hypothetical protein [Aureimonas altamirensis]|uniref:hypothetical protein n=1 Tax=Aureimonas altamirensis TaxID=370622 RepID=UPI0025572760|nr:hypothetical protein [Aureimonas altamirensis]
MMTYASPKSLSLIGLGLLGVYVAAAFILPGAFLSGLFAAIQLVFALLISLTWLPDTWKSLHEPKLRSAHMTLLGISLLALGSAYSGTWGLLWNITGQPEAWTGTGLSSFGRALMSGGFICLLISPAQAPRPVIAWSLWLIVAFVALLVAAAFLAGFAFNPRAI